MDIFEKVLTEASEASIKAYDLLNESLSKKLNISKGQLFHSIVYMHKKSLSLSLVQL